MRAADPALFVAVDEAVRASGRNWPLGQLSQFMCICACDRVVGSLIPHLCH